MRLVSPPRNWHRLRKFHERYFNFTDNNSHFIVVYSTPSMIILKLQLRFNNH